MGRDIPDIRDWGKRTYYRRKNPKLRGSLAAIRCAAEMARRTAILTNTGIVVVLDGKRGEHFSPGTTEGEGVSFSSNL